MPTPGLPHPPQRPPAADAGFTLVEILVALVILGVALTALLSAEAAGVRLRSQSQELTLATFLAQARMTDVELAGFPDLGTREGDFGDAYPGYRWQLNVTEAPFPKVREVRVLVRWPAGAREERLEITNFMVDLQ